MRKSEVLIKISMVVKRKRKNKLYLLRRGRLYLRYLHLISRLLVRDLRWLQVSCTCTVKLQKNTVLGQIRRSRPNRAHFPSGLPVNSGYHLLLRPYVGDFKSLRSGSGFLSTLSSPVPPSLTWPWYGYPDTWVRCVHRSLRPVSQYTVRCDRVPSVHSRFCSFVSECPVSQWVGADPTSTPVLPPQCMSSVPSTDSPSKT